MASRCSVRPKPGISKEGVEDEEENRVYTSNGHSLVINSNNIGRCRTGKEPKQDGEAFVSLQRHRSQACFQDIGDRRDRVGVSGRSMHRRLAARQRQCPDELHGGKTRRSRSYARQESSLGVYHRRRGMGLSAATQRQYAGRRASPKPSGSRAPGANTA